ncbi:MAG: hypothetical protein ACWGNV_02300 [Bacteroidales bacterium]
MKPFQASILHAIILVAFGLWGYFGPEDPSLTALIPVATGVVLLLLNRGLRKQNRTIAHIVVILTFLILIALIKPLTGSIQRSDTSGLMRVLVMMAASALAMVYFIKSFVDARRKPKSGDS